MVVMNRMVKKVHESNLALDHDTWKCYHCILCNAELVHVIELHCFPQTRCIAKKNVSPLGYASSHWRDESQFYEWIQLNLVECNVHWGVEKLILD